jgi:hypothetical protein
MHPEGSRSPSILAIILFLGVCQCTYSKNGDVCTISRPTSRCHVALYRAESTYHICMYHLSRFYMHPYILSILHVCLIGTKKSKSKKTLSHEEKSSYSTFLFSPSFPFSFFLFLSFLFISLSLILMTYILYRYISLDGSRYILYIYLYRNQKDPQAMKFIYI